MDSILPVAFDGVVYASWLFLMSAGLTLIYGVMRILNVAHGSLYAPRRALCRPCGGIL
jgi:branched-chain amino acid transport system permease protein